MENNACGALSSQIIVEWIHKFGFLRVYIRYDRMHHKIYIHILFYVTFINMKKLYFFYSKHEYLVKNRNNFKLFI